VAMLPCPPEHWSRFSQLLDIAMELPEPTRVTWLQNLEGADSELRPWLARVLGSAASIVTSDFLDAPHLADPPEQGFAAGDLIGPYLLISVLGEGGMGQVWRASRGDDGPQREVALKLPYAEMLAGPFRQRFRRERDMVAALSHPNIGALFDAGVSADGHPYLALELVNGRPITAHCQSIGASLERRVELIQQVLAALGYAHSHLIVHRDIKPSNVMVTPQGQVKLLDFGIAKMLHATSTDEAPLTQANAHLATPGYAAPEQMEDGPVTVATDLFSTGVLLFELCTGNRPKHLRAPDGEAPLASGRAATNPEFKGFARRLRGDLDAIIAKALSIDPAHRYASADAFARDLQRWSEGLPISARRIGWPTYAAKFARRNKVGVALAGVLLLSLVGGSAGIAWQAQRAEREAVRATAIKGFLIDLFEKGDPRAGSKPSDVTVMQLLDFGASKVDTSFAQDPETEIDLLETLGDIYEALDDAPDALRLGARRVELARKVFGPADPRVVDGTITLANDQVFFLDRKKALDLLEDIREPIFTKYGDDSLERAEWLSARSDALRATHGARDEAIAESLQAVAIFGKYFPKAGDYSQALVVLAGYQYDAEQYQQALDSMNRERDMQKSLGKFDDFENLQYTTQAGNIQQHLGHIKEAQDLWYEGEVVAERTVGRGSTWYLASLNFIAQSKNRQGKRAEALALFGQALSISGGNAAATGQVTSVLRAYGISLAAQGDYPKAIPILEKVLQQTRVHERDEPSLRSAEGLLGDAYDQAGRAQDARPLLQASRDEWIRYGVPNGAQTLGARARWALFLFEHGDPHGASDEFNEVLKVAAGAPSVPAAQAQAGLAAIALAQGDMAQSDLLSAQSLRTLDAVTLDYDVRAKTDLWLMRAASLLANGHAEQAREFAMRAMNAANDWDAPGSAQIARAQAMIAQINKASQPLPVSSAHKNV